MQRGCCRKLSNVVFITIFMLLLLNSFSFAETLENNGIKTNYKVFDGRDSEFIIPKAVEYYDSDYNYYIVLEQGIQDAVAKIIQSTVNKLPEAMVPEGVKLVIAFKNTANYEPVQVGDQVGELNGSAWKNEIYFQAEKLNRFTIIHEITHYTEAEYDGDTLSYIFNDTPEYMEALENDLDLNGGQYATPYAEEFTKANDDNREQLAELLALIYLGGYEGAAADGALDQAANEIKKHPNQAKFIIEEIAKGVPPPLPSGVNYKDLINEGLKGSGSSQKNNMSTVEPEIDSSNAINDNGISSYSDDDSLGSGEEDSDADSESEYYIDEEVNPYYYDEEGTPYYYDEEGNPYYEDEDGNPYYYDEEGNPYYEDEEGNSYYYDEEGNPYYEDEEGNPYYYDEEGNPYYEDGEGNPYPKSAD